MTTNRTPCSICGFLHRYKGALPVGRKAICKNCEGEFVIEQSVATPDGVKFLRLDVEGVGSTPCVGTSYYRKNLLELLSKLGSNPDDPIAFSNQTFLLIPETDNEHDPNAVRVEVGDLQIGHLSRRDAAIHREYLRDSGKPLWRMAVSGNLVINWEDGVDGPYVESFKAILNVSWGDA